MNISLQGLNKQKKSIHEYVNLILKILEDVIILEFELQLKEFRFYKIDKCKKLMNSHLNYKLL